MATVLYTALADLEVFSVIASWPCPTGSTLPLDPSKATTKALVAAGKITPAPPWSVDTTTPADVLRGMPGLAHVGVSN